MYIALAIIALVIIYLVGFFNQLKTLQVRITASIQEIGNQLKRQSGLIPNLADSVKGYLKHEKDVFKMLTDARTHVQNAIKTNDAKTIDKAQDLINQAMRSIQIAVESNPQLQASGLVTNLMNELRDTADKVMYARRTLIDLAADFNVKISVIPGIWIAPLMGFSPQKGLDTPVSGEFLEVSSTDTANPKVNLQ